MSADNDSHQVGKGLEAKLSLDVVLGQLSDTVGALGDAIHKFLEPNPVRSPLIRKLNVTKTAPATAPTYTFMDMGGPNNGFVWDVRRYAVHGGDPFATLTGVSVITFVAQQVPGDSNTEPPFMDMVDTFSNVVPNSTTWGSGELTLLPGERLVLCLKGLANNQVVQMALQVDQTREDEIEKVLT